MESFMPRSRQWGRVVSVLFALLALARARQQSEVESDVLRILPDIYTGGPGYFNVSLLDIAKGENEAPRPLLITVPVASGKFPVVQFQHGWRLHNTDYTQLLLPLASYGYIVVAPQISIVANLDPSGKPEICEAVSVINWLEPGLNQTLSKYLEPLKVEPELHGKLAVVGHSRGGKVVFGVAKGFCETTLKLKLSAIVGLDPVDGLILPVLPDLNLSIPTLIVGGGQTSTPRPWDSSCLDPFPRPVACGPVSVSHQKFFDGSGALAFHFVAPNDGHLDYLNGKCPGDVGCCYCKNGPDREAMRNFTVDITARFFEGYLKKQSTIALCIAYLAYDTAPVTLQKPEIHGEIEGCRMSAQEA